MRWLEEAPPGRLRAQLTDKDGTDLTATMSVVDEGTTTRCDIVIAGHVFLGGFLGRLVSAATIQSKAQEKIKEMLDEQFAGTPSKRAPLVSTTSPSAPLAPTSPPASASAPSARVPVSAPAPRAPRTPPSVAVACAARARTRVDGSALESVHVAFVRALAHSKGSALDDTGAARVLARMGASPSAQTALARDSAEGSAAGLKCAVAAYALTRAVLEVAPDALARTSAGAVGDDAVDERLRDSFESSYERVLGSTLAVHASGASGLTQKLAELEDARAADLLSDDEVITLRERVLASL